MLTKRELLKLGLLTGGSLLLSGKAGLRLSLADTSLQSPRTQPFLDELPFPPPPIPVGAFSDVASEALPYAGPATTYYKLIVEPKSDIQFHSQLPPTPNLWHYRDSNVSDWRFALGPTFVVHVKDDIQAGNIVRFVNQLPPHPSGFGVSEITTHLHGGHVPSRSDGFPADITVNGQELKHVFVPGEQFDYTYPIVDPGSVSDTPDPTERPSTLWYHDHILDFTAENVYRGLAGFFLVYEDPKSTSSYLRETARDTGDETNADKIPNALRLPSAPFDIPIVLQDKIFAADGSMVYDPFSHDGFLGDKFVLNGKIQPFLKVKRRKYRFRFLNGSNARFYGIFLTDSSGHTFPMTMIATEGGLLSRPIRDIRSFLLAMAERVEVVIDFTMFKEGDEVYLENRLEQDDGRGPSGTFEQPGILSSGTRLLKFIVQETVDDPSQVPDVLRPFDKISNAELASAKVRQFEFNRSHGAWTINDQLVNLNRPMATPPINGPEIWRLKNSSGGWWHPIHVHSEFGRVISRNGQRPSPFLREQDGIGKKDTFVLGPGSEVEVFFKFRDFAGPYVFHCHNLEHEDMAMMARFDVVPVAGIPSL